MKKVLAILLALFLLIGSAVADSLYILCQPDSFVNVRAFPRKGAEIAGRVELGDELETDGVRRNGYIHVCGFEGGGWISTGFVTFTPVTVFKAETQINAKGRVACRRSINGTRRKWLSDGQKVVIFAFSDDWAITNQGFIKVRYLGVF